ncbi:unnamed protein product [Bathycoccus prasinos]
MLALPWKRGFGDVLTNIRDNSLSIFVKKQSRASDTQILQLATWPDAIFSTFDVSQPPTYWLKIFEQATKDVRM